MWQHGGFHHAVKRCAGFRSSRCRCNQRAIRIRLPREIWDENAYAPSSGRANVSILRLFCDTIHEWKRPKTTLSSGCTGSSSEVTPFRFVTSSRTRSEIPAARGRARIAEPSALRGSGRSGTPAYNGCASLLSPAARYLIRYVTSTWRPGISTTPYEGVDHTVTFGDEPMTRTTIGAVSFCQVMELADRMATALLETRASTVTAPCLTWTMRTPIGVAASTWFDWVTPSMQPAMSPNAERLTARNAKIW